MNLYMTRHENHSRNKASVMLDVSDYYKGVVRESLRETHNRACVNVKKKSGGYYFTLTLRKLHRMNITYNFDDSTILSLPLA